ncbi:MAG: oligosaccharide flippase family protein [Candidatus Marinimicrobia bacterium]|nr:oligosaccharide flippase family protein [Candidatus Neomarinimicrobiota bacterium]
MIIKNILKKGTFASNVAILSSGSVLGQLIVFLISPVLTRVFQAEAFANLAVVVSIYSIIGSIVTLRYEMAIPLVKDERDCNALIVLNFLLALALISIISIIFFLFKEPISLILKLRMNKYIIYILPLSIFFEALRNIFRFVYIRSENYKALSLSAVIRSSSISTFQLFFGFVIAMKKLGLIFGHIIGQMFELLWLVFKYFKKGWAEFLKNISFSRMLYNAKKYKNFPIYSSWNILLNKLSLNLPVLLLVTFYPKELVGLYALSIRVLNTPFNILGNSIGQVYYQQISKYLRNNIKITKFVITTSLKLFIIVLFPLLVIKFWGEEIFMFVFGNEWSESGKVASLLVPLYLTRLTVSPISSIFAATNKQYVSLIWQFIYLAGIFMCLYLPRGSIQFFEMVNIFSLVVTLLYIILFLFVIIVVKLADRKITRDGTI